MKVCLYHDERVSAKDAPDAWSIYCPYPEKYQRVTGIKGIYLGCKRVCHKFMMHPFSIFFFLQTISHNKTLQKDSSTIFTFSYLRYRFSLLVHNWA